MAIYYDSTKKIFSLETINTSYQCKIDDYGFLLHLYYGKKIKGSAEHLLLYVDRGFSGNPYDAGEDRAYSMDVLPQEFPSMGNGDYRSCALRVKNADGTYSCDLRYKSHSITEGKYGLRGLPAVYAAEAEAQTLEIVLEDTSTALQVVLLYGVLPELDIITRSVKVSNGGTDEIHIEKIQSACLDFLYGSYDLLTFYGRHAMERNMQRMPIGHGSQKIGSRRGTSSHQYNPMMIVAETSANEDAGNCYAMSLMYSGGFSGESEMDQLNSVRMMIGLPEEMFSYPLGAREEFYAPEVILTYSSQGLNKLSQNLHTCIRTHVCRGTYKDTSRPILVNSWEAAYFDFTGDTIFHLAQQAKEVGIDMVVMDDGWFGKRDDDNSSLGDWYVNEKKLGSTLGELIRRINGIGVKFGIWVEPEMISEDSDLYRSHPDWAFTIPGRKPVRSRNQLVLDFSRKEVVEYIYDSICKVLDMGNIEYLKWDMNRSITDVYSAAAKEQGRVLHDYVLGLYDFLERINKRYPNILVEGCSGGGGRFDAGMMYYTPQIWCSDNTDAIDRLHIQYGTSFGYPVSAVGAHVSAVPNHQTGRITSLAARAVTAMSGTFGYELNLSIVSEEEKDQMRHWNKQFRRYEQLIREGLYFRLTNPAEAEAAVWEIASEDKSEALLNAVVLKTHGNMTANYVRLKGLCPNADYKEEESGRIYSGSVLMEGGICLPILPGEYNSCQLYFKRTA